MAVRKGGKQPRRMVSTLGEGIPQGYLDLIQELITARVAQDIATRDMADILGINVKTLWAWEHPETSDRIVNALDLVHWATALKVRMTVR